jgi:hypothetical protein
MASSDMTDAADQVMGRQCGSAAPDRPATKGLVTWAKKHLGLTLETVIRPKRTPGFVILPRLWVVERSLAWIMHARWHARDYERLIQHSESLITSGCDHAHDQAYHPAPVPPGAAGGLPGSAPGLIVFELPVVGLDSTRPKRPPVSGARWRSVALPRVPEKEWNQAFTGGGGR